MQTAQITEYARALYAAHGDKAEAEAAQKAKRFESRGDIGSADNWRAIRRAIKEYRGAHQT